MKLVLARQVVDFVAGYRSSCLALLVETGVLRSINLSRCTARRPTQILARLVRDVGRMYSRWHGLA